jgi:hypothetical protein
MHTGLWPRQQPEQKAFAFSLLNPSIKHIPDNKHMLRITQKTSQAREKCLDLTNHING